MWTSWKLRWKNPRRGYPVWRLNTGVAESSFSFQLASLEVSRFKPVWRFLNGHYFSVEKLKGKIEGLPDYSIDLWHADYSEFLHAVLRGKQLDVADVHRLNKEFALGETEILLDMNLAARFVRRRLEVRRLLRSARLQSAARRRCARLLESECQAPEFQETEFPQQQSQSKS